MRVRRNLGVGRRVNLLQLMRHWQRRSAGAIAGMIATLGISFAFQACAIASDAGPCPHCPATVQLDTHAHGLLGMPADMPPQCGVVDRLDDPDALTKSASDTDHVRVLGAVPAEYRFDARWPFSSTLAPPSHTSAASRYGPRLNLEYCVFTE